MNIFIALIFSFMPAIFYLCLHSDCDITIWLCRVAGLACIGFLSCTGVYIIGYGIIFVIGLPHPFKTWLLLAHAPLLCLPCW